MAGVGIWIAPWLRHSFAFRGRRLSGHAAIKPIFAELQPVTFTRRDDHFQATVAQLADEFGWGGGIGHDGMDFIETA
jgi:hypothetical protein